MHVGDAGRDGGGAHEHTEHGEAGRGGDQRDGPVAEPLPPSARERATHGRNTQLRRSRKRAVVARRLAAVRVTSVTASEDRAERATHRERGEGQAEREQSERGARGVVPRTHRRGRAART